MPGKGPRCPCSRVGISAVAGGGGNGWGTRKPVSPTAPLCSRLTALLPPPHQLGVLSHSCLPATKKEQPRCPAAPVLPSSAADFETGGADPRVGDPDPESMPRRPSLGSGGRRMASRAGGKLTRGRALAQSSLRTGKRSHAPLQNWYLFTQPYFMPGPGHHPFSPHKTLLKRVYQLPTA